MVSAHLDKSTEVLVLPKEVLLNAENRQQVLQAVEFLRDLVENNGLTLEEAVNRLRSMGIREEFISGALERLAELQAEVLEGCGSGALIRLRGLGAAEPWYPGERANHVFWPALRRHLEISGRATEAIKRLDLESDRVLASCQSPWNAVSNGRGLVIGNVQSGKTSNFTAVISKAADAGFRLFIVLSGVTTGLRKQTQERLDRDIYGLNDLSWIRLTSADSDIGAVHGIFPVLNQRSLRTYAVVKKNVSRLKRLNKFLDESQRRGHLDDCPILVIDDEGDQASLSPSCNPAKLTAINKQLVKLLDRPRISYVAYTATPFANVFVSPFYDENLYPRDFIYSLSEPDGYFGARRLFGQGPEDDGVDVIRAIEPAEEEAYFGPIAPQPCPSLIEAVAWFLMAATARRLRSNGVQPHTTMIINASERVGYHFDLRPHVTAIIREIRDRLPNDEGLRTALTEQWETEVAAVPPSDFGLEKIPATAILAGIPETIMRLGDISEGHVIHPDSGVIVDNYHADVRLAYDDEAQRPIIVIGGNTLSRGLTLEGLVSSVFARSTKMYDSLLQMGRWFGYRPGYEDLPRVWMFGEAIDRFTHLSKVENELRDEVRRYEETGLSPHDFGVRIRRHPSMEITRRAFLRNVRNVRLSLSGSRPQTTFFANQQSVIKRNEEAVNRLVSSVHKAGLTGKPIEGGTLFRGVGSNAILDFFDEKDGFSLCESNEYFHNGAVCQYISARNRNRQLMQWNVVFRTKDGAERHPRIDGVDLSLVTRAQLKGSSGMPVIAIGVLTDPNDQFRDVPSRETERMMSWRDREGIPLLVVYGIDRDSRARAGRGNRRCDLEAVDHLIGLGVFFPAIAGDEPIDYAVVHGPWDLRPVGDDFDGEVDDEEDNEGDYEGDERGREV